MQVEAEVNSQTIIESNLVKGSTGEWMPSLTRRTVSANDTHAFLRHHQSRTVSWNGPQAKRRLDIF